MKNPSKFLFLAILVFYVIPALAADTITGTVRDQTVGKPAAGDEVVLLLLGQGMQEESRAKTDAEGKFTLNVSSPQESHVIQVSHQGVNYDQPVNGNGPVEVLVYDAVARIPGIGGPIGMAQVESNGKLLKVTEMYDVRNESNPPVTQSGANNFEVTIPSNAVIDEVHARRAQGIWLKMAAAPIAGKAGKYGINYPIRPGDTVFSISYHLPYQGSATLHLTLPYPMKQFGITHPPSMAFKALTPNTFVSATVGSVQVEQVRSGSPVSGAVPAFQVAGVGVAPPPQPAQASPAQGAQGSPAVPSVPQVVAPAGNAAASRHNAAPVVDQSRKELWLMIGGIVFILVVGILGILKNRRKPVSAVTANSKEPLLDALKEELFQLESDRLHGSISDEEYAVTKQALSESIERAMSRK
jgi:hypothetical protein